MSITRLIKRLIEIPFVFFFIPTYVVCALYSRFFSNRKKIDVGLGPEPLINNIYHKKALNLYGYSAETFVYNTYHITNEFDFLGHKLIKGRLWRELFLYYFLFFRSILKYRGIYLYYNGGSLHQTIWWKMEPLLYKLASLKIVVMPYGSDIQDMGRSNNLLFKHNLSIDYPTTKLTRKTVQKRIDLWTTHADSVISGCEWVDYMYYWDVLMVAHFSIDLEKWKPSNNITQGDTFKILHAPNHTNIKGTRHFQKAIKELIVEGLNIELILLQKVPNEKVKFVMEEVDVVADQLIIGWYAMFAIEAMALKKPVICYLRRDFEELFIESGLIKEGEIPIINTNFTNIKQTIKELYSNRQQLAKIGQNGREYVSKHHSLKAVGNIFNQINQKIGLNKII